MKIAKINYNETIYEARGDGVLLASPVRALIESVYTHHTAHARYILRQPIILNYEPSLYEQALIKLGAKRFRVEMLQEASDASIGSDAWVSQKESERIVNCERVPAAELQPLEPRPIFNSQFEATTWFKSQAENTGIIAAYVNSRHKITTLVPNTNKIIKTRHAEINLIEKLINIKPEKGDYVLVSLQSCRMCAAALAEWLGQENITVYYLKAEPSLASVKTALFGREQIL